MSSFCRSVLFLILFGSVARAETKLEYFQRYDVNSRIAKVISQLNYASFEKIRNSLKRPKDQDKWKMFYLKVKSHPLKSFPLFDRLVISSGKEIHAVHLQSLKPFIVSVDDGKAVELNLDNAHGGSSRKTGESLPIQLLLPKAKAEGDAKQEYWKVEDFMGLYEALGKSGSAFHDSDTNDFAMDENEDSRQQRNRLAYSVKELFNHFNIKQFMCPPDKGGKKFEIDDYLFDYGADGDKKFYFLFSTQNGSLMGGGCTEPKSCHFFPVVRDTTDKLRANPYAEYSLRNEKPLLKAAIENFRRNKLLNDEQAKTLTDKVDKAISDYGDLDTHQMASHIDCDIKGFGERVFHTTALSQLPSKGVEIAKEDKCHLSVSEHGLEGINEAMKKPENELLAQARNNHDNNLLAELNKFLAHERRVAEASYGTALPELIKKGALEAINDCCKKEECRSKFSKNGQAVFSTDDDKMFKAKQLNNSNKIE